VDTRIRSRVVVNFVLAVLVAILGGASSVGAQTPATLTGRVLHSATKEPVSNALVALEELKLETKANPDGTYRFEGVQPGTYHLTVRINGFVPRREEVTIPAAGLVRDFELDPELHFSEVVSVSPEPRNQFESYQPTTVLAGADLTRQLQGTLGASLETQPGLSMRSFGPGPARPVIRGLDGDRVLILEDGQRMGDLSSQSGDHGVTTNPAAASRLEVVRGPASLLYGSNAIGGLVNVINEAIPAQPIRGATGSVVLDGGTAATEGGGAAAVSWGNGTWAARFGGGGRRSGDVDTPEGTIDNSQSRSGMGSLALSWTSQRGYLGGSYGYEDTKYGIPVVESGNIQLTPRRHLFSFRGERQDLSGPFTTIRASAGVRRYKHEELDGDEIGTAFTNNTTEVEAQLKHREAGALQGTIGFWGLARAFSAEGAEALSPPVDQSGFAAFLYEEVTRPHVTFQFGGRVERAAFSPQGGLPDRDFTNFSGSVGLLVRPTDTTTMAFSVARAARNPALEELYFNGPHPGNFAVEIGNPDLESEKAIGFDLSFRWRHQRASGELTYFLNDINSYIFRQPTGEIEDDFPVVEFVAADARLQGVEGHLDTELGAGLSLELGVDYVRGDLTSGDEPLPRIPPLRVRTGLRYQKNAFQAGGEVISAAKQDRVFPTETVTDGYNLLKLFASYTFMTGRSVSTLTARLDNATNELYRNHLSFIKDFVPEMGRNFKVVYGVRF
jgi:iron complex outermembrane receptor protein